MDQMIRQHLTQQGMLMKRGMATSRLYINPDEMGLGMKSVARRVPHRTRRAPLPIQEGDCL